MAALYLTGQLSIYPKCLILPLMIWLSSVSDRIIDRTVSRTTCVTSPPVMSGAELLQEECVGVRVVLCTGQRGAEVVVCKLATC